MPDMIEKELRTFKTRMLIERPFYGDILLRLPIIRDDSISTACTDGRAIRWNERFFRSLTPPQQHYVLMHEVFHILLKHPLRLQERDPEIWNAAADIIVNNMCDRLALDLRLHPGLELQRPPDGIFRDTDQTETAENLYERIREDNRKHQGNSREIMIRRSYRSYAQNQPEKTQVPEGDLLGGGIGGVNLSEEEMKALEAQIASMISEAGSHSRGSDGSGFIPRELLHLTKSAVLDWRGILRDFLTEVESDETSYTTPERKYLHMGLILPGHGLKEEGELESLWAFVDSSGSVSQADLNEFLTQLYRIAKEYRCEVNIAYWDTSVTDVYEKLRREKQVLEAQPHHSGGTDINCVYRYARERNLRPWVSLILTDGDFGIPDASLQKALPRKSTILLLCNNSNKPVYQTVGKVCRLKKDQ